MVAAQLVVRKPTSKRFKDLTGRKFGRLTVESFAGFQGKFAKWKCKCDCGGESTSFGNQLSAGHIQSCGCLRMTHGMSDHPLFPTWQQMLQRCHNENNTGYKNYGARGISVCQRWRDSFADFIADVGERPSDEHSIGRIDNDGNYEPDNVRWETRQQQGENRRSNRYVTFNGKTQTMSEWAREAGITREAMRLRLKKDAPLESILMTPKGKIVNPAFRESVDLCDDFNPWPAEFKLGEVLHATCDTSGAAAEACESLRTVAAKMGYEFRSRVLGEHILFRFKDRRSTP